MTDSPDPVPVFAILLLAMQFMKVLFEDCDGPRVIAVKLRSDIYIKFVCI